ncbi:hypothetical protein SAMN04488109_4781 [Chryseolinea serpens]|uniref:Uncharacterized protein n=1 Tax=Chryseolinea serpens TaxID=947013 RepID=A0A1M5UMH1_9BACT|nr:hypothetical protein [Chryseolinea serpens]SHH64205.1 hypothetical protein SAMN04488109_4781 [Chryseolinea serpens]
MNRLKNISLHVILGVSFLLSSCHKDDEVTGPHTILTLQVDAGYTLATDDNWIFATDDAGEVLDVKSYAGGETVTLVSDKAGDKITVTFFRHHEASSKTSIFNTYAGIPSGTALHLIVPAPSRRESLPGKATFMISNFHPGSSFVQFSNGDSYSASGTITSTEADMEVSFYGVPSDFVLSGYRAGVPVYNWAKEVKDGDIIKRDFDTDFVALPHQRTLDFEGVNTATLSSSDGKSNFSILDTYSLMGTAYATDHPVIGYLDGFASNLLVVTNTKANGRVSYRNDGEIDFSFTMPTFTFSLQSNGIRDLAFSFSEDHNYYFSNWDYTQDTEWIRWYFSAPAGVSTKSLSVPHEIAAKYSQIDVSKFVLLSINFTKIIEGASYPQDMPGMKTSDDKTRKQYTFSPKL